MEQALLEVISTPIGSIAIQPEEHKEWYMLQWNHTSPTLKKILQAPSTGAFIRGLAKNYSIPIEQSPFLALIVFRTGVGATPLTKLASELAAVFHMPPDKAAAMAKEIEKELFAPVMLELQKSGGGSQATPSSTGSQPGSGADMPNVLDLKKNSPH